jgi:hypothetical protein
MQPGETREHPRTGFHVVSVHSIDVAVAMRHDRRSAIGWSTKPGGYVVGLVGGSLLVFGLRRGLVTTPNTPRKDAARSE